MAAKTTAVARQPGSQISVSSVAELGALAEMLYRGGLAPAGIDNPNKVAAVILAGMEVGLAPTQALGSIMLTNGRLSIYGDGAMALVRASGLLESIEERVEGEGDDRRGVCIVKRKGEPERTYTFSIREANQAGLIERARGKDGKGRGPWISYPDRMLIMRPRGFAFRDVFPDVLRGLVFFEEAQDTQTEVVVVSSRIDPPQPATVSASTPEAVPSLPPAVAMVTDDQLKELAAIRASMIAGKSLKTPDDQKAAWAELLATYGVKTAKEFTQEQAAKFISEQGPIHDPFGHPPKSLPSAA